MKAVQVVRFVCISWAWYAAAAAAAGESEARAEKPVGDDPIKVNLIPRERSHGMEGCFKTPVPPSSMVRIQSLKTFGGSVYRRQLVTTADLPCFGKSVSKDLPAVANIADCAEATAKEGLNSFLWEGGACTAFLAWRPRARANCEGGGSRVVYVAEEQLTPFAGVEVVVSGKIRYGAPEVYLDLGYHQYCGLNMSRGFKLQWNGTQEVMLRQGTTTYSLDRQLLCFISTNWSLWSIGADGHVNSIEQQLSIDRGTSRWYGSPTGSCVYLSKNKSLSGGVVQDCRSLALPSVFAEQVDGVAAAFLEALDASDEFPKDTYNVGLRRNGSQWFWTGGLEQPIVDAAVWSPTHPLTEWDFVVYGVLQYVNGKWGIASADKDKLTYALCYVSKP